MRSVVRNPLTFSISVTIFVLLSVQSPLNRLFLSSFCMALAAFADAAAFSFASFAVAAVCSHSLPLTFSVSLSNRLLVRVNNVRSILSLFDIKAD